MKIVFRTFMPGTCATNFPGSALGTLIPAQNSTGSAPASPVVPNLVRASSGNEGRVLKQTKTSFWDASPRAVLSSDRGGNPFAGGCLASHSASSSRSLARCVVVSAADEAMVMTMMMIEGCFVGCVASKHLGGFIEFADHTKDRQPIE